MSAAEEKSFAQLIREVRERLGLTQREVAAQIQATGAYISALESGKKTPPPRPTVLALAYALRLDPEELWAFALQERERRALEKARSRASRLQLPSSKGVKNRESQESTDGQEAQQLEEVLRLLRIDPEFQQACLDLQAVFTHPKQRQTAIHSLAALAALVRRDHRERSSPAAKGKRGRKG